MSKGRYRGIPVSAAKALAKKYGKDQVIIVTWDKLHGKEHVTTYGATVDDCAMAAMGGNRVKAALGWPESLRSPLPARAVAERCDSVCDGMQCQKRLGHRGMHRARDADMVRSWTGRLLFR